MKAYKRTIYVLNNQDARKAVWNRAANGQRIQVRKCRHGMTAFVNPMRNIGE